EEALEEQDVLLERDLVVGRGGAAADGEEVVAGRGADGQEGGHKSQAHAAAHHDLTGDSIHENALRGGMLRRGQCPRARRHSALTCSKSARNCGLSSSRRATSA